MRGGDRRAPTSGHSLATNPTKRKHQPGSKSFIPIRCSHQTHKRQKHKQKQRKSDTIGSHRKWVFSSRDFSGYKDTVVVISYNILGVENTLKHPDLYFKVPPKFLDWDRRKQLICKEINHYHPSILCFQEVDRFDDLDDRLQIDGFKGVYKARTGEACDGCALFWKDELFTLLHQENIEFHRFGLRDNVAQLCILKMNENQSTADVNTQTSESPPTRSLLVGNIHVLFNPNRGDIKLGQVRLFLEKAHKLSQEWGNIPIVLAGDLNSMPQSAMYQFLASSELDIRLHDRRKISGQVEGPLQCRSFGSQNKDAARFRMSISNPLMYRWSDEELRLATGSDGVTHLRHHLKLSSAYMGVPGSCRTRYNYGEPLATSYHSKFMGTVDYIWHSEKLVPMRVLETLPIDILKKTGGLPSERWGSDHLAIACELAFVD
ncbi:hypothetical protein L1049_028278 [Liquidambar formosana]|uniref:Endonuclease/exonuclease/phosphatase domain-containing protein n=1 Tax=Liquidambar formosana TaxID=63359 RepID=A0AAP0RK05_LIQFO